MLSQFYLNHEVSLAEHAGVSHRDLLKQSSSSAILSIEQLRLRRLLYNIEAVKNTTIGGIRERTTQKILAGFSDTTRRDAALRSALKEAERYWEATLVQPDNTDDLQIEGRRRLTNIRAELEQLDAQPESA